MAAIAQTIAIVDKSGKVVSTSKQLKNVFKEAKLAYQERKAEIVSERRAREERELQKAIKAMSIADESRSDVSHSRSRGHRSQSRRAPELRVRPPTGERHYSNSSTRSEYVSPSQRSPGSPSISPRFPPPGYHSPQVEEDFYSNPRSVPVYPAAARASQDLVRRRTDTDLVMAHRPHAPVHTNSTRTLDTVDMDLAYGDFHPESISPVMTRDVEKQELSSLVTKCKMLLDEASCAQHSVKAIVAHLQKNPDAMAAVALTLAEISNIASKMAPGALTALKAGAPTVFALLAAPEFLIAVGVSVGITIVMFGGYKIIKHIRERNSEKEGVSGMDEMLEVGELDRIEHWRRGIADVDTASVATSVEGEFITPMAAASMGHLPLRDEAERETVSGSGSRKEKKEKKEKRKKSSSSSSKKTRPERSSTSGSTAASLGPGEAHRKAVGKVKKPSPLRRMFHLDDRSSVAS